MTKEEYGGFVFIHIPKCGGTSFRKYINDAALESGITNEEIYIPGFNGLSNTKNIHQLDKLELKKLSNSTIKIFANHSKYGELKAKGIIVDNPFHFTLLRNPVERFISHYHFFYYLNGYDNCKGIKLNDLDKNKLISLLDLISNIQVSYLSNIKHKKIVGDENMLKIAKYNLQHEINLFGFIEELEPTLAELKIIKPEWLEFKSQFPTLNTSKSKTHTVQKSILKLIKEANENDIKLYEFAKSLEPIPIN